MTVEIHSKRWYFWEVTALIKTKYLRKAMKEIKKQVLRPEEQVEETGRELELQTSIKDLNL